MSKEGQWDKMAARVPDDVVREFTAIGTYDQLTGAITERFGGIADSITLDFGRDTPDGFVRELVQDLQTIPSPFEGFPAAW